MDRPEIILAPGPTPIPPEVLLAQGSPLVYHRGPGFGKLMPTSPSACASSTGPTSAEIVLMTSSRHRWARVGDPELFSPGDEVFVPLAGFFSQRWQRLAAGLRPDRAHHARTSGGPGSTPRRSPAALAEHPGTRPCCSRSPRPRPA